MIVVHSGSAVPALARKWDPDEIDRVWFAWGDVLKGATISTSSWLLPGGWSGAGEQTSQSVTDSDGNEYSSANSVMLTASNRSGKYTITNRVVLSDGRQYDRSVTIDVQPL